MKYWGDMAANSEYWWGSSSSSVEELSSVLSGRIRKLISIDDDFANLRVENASLFLYTGMYAHCLEYNRQHHEYTFQNEFEAKVNNLWMSIVHLAAS